MSKLVIVGSSDLWVTPEIISIVLGKIMTTTPGTVLAVRAPRSAQTPTTQLEKFIWDMAAQFDRVAHMQIPTSNQKGDVYKRDYELVEGADGVLAFFAPDQEMEGGTGHVVQAALARSIPVEAYRMADNGRPELLGSDDGLINGGPSGGYIIPRSIPAGGWYGGNWSGTFTSNNTTFTDFFPNDTLSIGFKPKSKP